MMKPADKVASHSGKSIPLRSRHPQPCRPHVVPYQLSTRPPMPGSKHPKPHLRSHHILMAIYTAFPCLSAATACWPAFKLLGFETSCWLPYLTWFFECWQEIARSSLNDGNDARIVVVKQYSHMTSHFMTT